jgi:hypothetical protein
MVKPFGRFFAVKVIGLSPVAATLNKKVSRDERHKRLLN